MAAAVPRVRCNWHWPRSAAVETAVVTAKLWLKGTQGGQVFDRKLWFSDTYVRTPNGWRYVFGQSSLALPPGA